MVSPFLVFLFWGTLTIQLDAELLGFNWPDVNSPIKGVLQSTNRDKEDTAFGAHLHMISTFTLGAIIIFFFAPTTEIATSAIFAMITISIFGDLFAAIIGKQFGKHK